MLILWIKAFHVFFMIAWMAGIFYLPRLFVYHAESAEKSVHMQLKVMERRLWMFITPFAIITLILGVVLMYLYGADWLAASKWLHIKLTLVLGFYLYHGYLFVLLKAFARDENQHSAKFYRFLNEAPVLLLLIIVILAIVKPAW